MLIVLTGKLKEKIPASSIIFRSIEAKRTDTLWLKFVFSTDCDSKIADLLLHWESLVEFLLEKCSSIRVIEFTIDYELRSFDNNAEFVAHFMEMKQIFTERIFSGLSKGSAKAKMIVTLDLTCNTEQYMVKTPRQGIQPFTSTPGGEVQKEEK